MTEIEAPTRERLFLALPVPRHVIDAIQPTINHYPQYIEHRIPPAKWHLTLAFLGDVENPGQYRSRLLKPITQPFVPTVRLTHVGRGRKREQLWAYGERSTNLLNLRELLLERLKKMRFQWPAEATDEPHRDFIPHITVARFFPMTAGIGLADQALQVSFSADHIVLYKSTGTHKGSTYAEEGIIPLTV